MSSRLISVLCFCALLTACTGSKLDRSDHLVNVGTHRLHAHLMGEGSPPVVCDSGIGGRPEEWFPLQSRIARETLVVTYDRAGYGESEPGPLPRDSGREADELKALLEGAAITGPYILVGTLWGR